MSLNKDWATDFSSDFSISEGELESDVESLMDAPSGDEEGIGIIEDAANTIASDHPERAEVLADFGARLHGRWLRTGALNDLNEAVRITQEAIDLTPLDHPHRASHLLSLTQFLKARYIVRGEMSDLEECIRLNHEASNILQSDDPDCIVALYALSTDLVDRHLRTGSMKDLEEGIKSAREAAESGALTDSDRKIDCRLSLLYALAAKYWATDELSYLDETIQIAKDCVTMAASHSLNQMIPLYNLEQGLQERFEKTRTIEDLDEAILVAKDMACLMSSDDPNKADYLRSIGESHTLRYLERKEPEDLDTAISYYQSALDHGISPILSRIEAGYELFRRYLIIPDWKGAYTAMVSTIRLIPLLTPRALENRDKQYLLSQLVGLASDAAAAALHAEESAFSSVSVLEMGRGVLAGSLGEIRTDLSELEDKFPELASRFLQIRDQIDRPVVQNPSYAGNKGLFSRKPNLEGGRSNIQRLEDGIKDYFRQWGTDDVPERWRPQPSDLELHMPITRSSLNAVKNAPPWKAQADLRRDADQKLNDLLVEIRNQVGFEEFLLPPLLTQVQAAAEYGPIIVINVSTYRCDALLIELRQIRVVELPRLNKKEIQRRGQDLPRAGPRVLEWLWDTIAQPVLDALGFTEPPRDDSDWPHVWWIPTGVLSKFPIHAAGYHGQGSTNTVLDRVLSSYSSSIKAIISGRKRHASEIVNSTRPQQALLVAMQDTMEQPRLYFATTEVETLRNLCKSMAIEPIEPKKRKADILLHLQASKIFHFAGHGYTDDTDPLQSSLLLEDWKSDPLTVSNLLETDIREHEPFLAFLSACGTGQIKNERLFDENIHLISACQLVGFRHVIGTLWEVNDEICVDMARTVYEGMRDGGMTDLSVCWGLHRASRELRDRWLGSSVKDKRVGAVVDRHVLRVEVDQADSLAGEGQQEKIAPRDGHLLKIYQNKGDPLYWVPYVHFGV